VYYQLKHSVQQIVDEVSQGAVALFNLSPVVSETNDQLLKYDADEICSTRSSVVDANSSLNINSRLQCRISKKLSTLQCCKTSND
jgi:hypothetical protein